MEVSDNEVCVVEVNIHRHCCHKDSAQPSYDEHRNKAGTIQHHTVEPEITAPDCSDPVEHFDGRRKCNHHRGRHESHTQGWIHAAGKHVVAPHDKAESGDGGHRINHRFVAEHRFAAHAGKHVRDHSHRRQQHDVNRGV